jgi:imidazolonepropionase-like amidohydrolase
MRRFAIVLALVSTLVPLGVDARPSQEPAPVRYLVITAGRTAGEQVVRQLGGGRVEATFEFNDRGRGPKTLSRIEVGDGGVPTRVEVTGNDYYKNTITETFSVENGVARWKNESERGEAPAVDRRFYVSLNGAPVEGGLLARALLAAPGQRLALLPAGEVRIRTIGPLEISADGAKRTVVQYAIEGLSFDPSPIWLDADGTYFANVSSWTTVIREGWQSAIPALLAAQEKAAGAWTEDLARSVRHVPRKGIAFTGASVFDAVSGTVKPRMTVVVLGNRITAVGPEGAVKVPDGVDVVDARGKTLLPGLWDMHVHLSGVDGALHIAAGVTTARDLGNDYETLRALRDRFDAGTAVGPRVIMAGLVDGPGQFAAPTGVLVDTPDEARAAVRKLKSEGYVQVKIYSSVKPELVPVIAGEAHKLGMRVSGHVPAFMTAEQAVRAGYDEIQHVNMLFLNFLFDTVKDTRTPARFTAVAEHAAELDLGSPKVREFIKLLQERRTVVDPTANAFEELFVARKGQISPVFAAVADRMPPQVRRGFLAVGLPVPEGMDARYRASFEQVLSMVALLYKSGIQIVVGTDSLAGFAYHRELELYVKAGIPETAVLQMATIGAARVMGREKELGSIEKGKLADLVLVDGNPASDISDVRKTSLVVKDGAVYRPAEIYGAVGVRP